MHHCNKGKLIKTSIIVLMMLSLSACTPQTYITRPDPVIGITIYTTDAEKIKGTWVYIIDDSVASASRQIKASSHACSLHTYPVNAGDALVTSIGYSMERLFQTAIPRKEMPPENVIEKEGLTGSLIIKLDEFYPRFNCSVGQFEGYCTASTDLSFTAILVDFASMKRKYIHVTSQRTADGGSGEMCAGVSNIISESVKRATKDCLERLSEKISINLILTQRSQIDS
jgi:hypothetical protein